MSNIFKLTEIAGVGKKRAHLLIQNGITEPRQVAQLSVDSLKLIIGQNISDELCLKIIESALHISSANQKTSKFQILLDKIENFKKQAPIAFVITIFIGIAAVFGAVEKFKILYDLYVSKDHGIYVNLFRPNSKTGDNKIVSTLIDTSIKAENVVYLGVNSKNNEVVCAQIPFTLVAVQAADIIDVDFIFEFEYNKSINIDREMFSACNTEMYMNRLGSTISFKREAEGSGNKFYVTYNIKNFVVRDFVFIEFAIPVDLSKIQDLSGKFVFENKITLKPSVLYNKSRRDFQKTDIFPVKACDMPELYISAGFFNASILENIVNKASWHQKLWHSISGFYDVVPFEKIKNTVQGWSPFKVRSVVALYQQVGVVTDSGLSYLSPSVDIDNFDLRVLGLNKNGNVNQGDNRKEAIKQTRETVIKNNINSYRERGFSCG